MGVAGRRACRRSSPRGGGGGRRDGRAERHEHPGPRVAADRGLDVDAGAHRSGQLGDDGQPEAGPLPPTPDPVGAEVPSEDLVQLVGGDPRTVVPHPDGRGGSGSARVAMGSPTMPTRIRLRAKEAAFSTRLATIWPRRSASACTHRGPSDPGASCRSRPSSWACGRNPSTTWRTTNAASTGRRSSEKRSESNRARSRRSCTSRSSRRASELMTEAAAAGSSVAPSMTASA